MSSLPVPSLIAKPLNRDGKDEFPLGTNETKAFDSRNSTKVPAVSMNVYPLVVFFNVRKGFC